MNLWKDQLRRERIQRNWRQQDLADQLGTTVVSVQRWERGSHSPSAYFRVKLCALFGKSAEELGFASAQVPPPVTEKTPPHPSGGNGGMSPEATPPSNTPEETASLPPNSASEGPRLASTVLGKSWGDEGEERDACMQDLPHPLGPPLLRGYNRAQRRQDHRDRGILLSRLRWDYHKDLEESLERLAWQEIGLAEQPAVVRNATHLSQRRPDQTERLLPPGTSLLQVYETSAQALLILGEPGAGKSTLLTRLALDLVERATDDLGHPIPVIVPLSSWAEHKPVFEDWLVDQLADRYELPRMLGQRWLQQNQLILLLDGLDEMEEAARQPCIRVINAFRQTHLSPLVVCSRTAEYHDASVQQRLALQNAVVVQPLTQEQILQEMQRGGAALASLREALRTNLELRALATSPLMLSVLVLTYYGKPLSEIPRQRKDLERQVWGHYVTRMLVEKGKERPGSGDPPQKCYAPEQTRSWLWWLAGQMQTHQQTWFYGEYLEESWLPALSSRMEVWMLRFVPAILLGAAITILLALVLLQITSPVALLQQGLVGGFLGWCVSRQESATRPSAQQHLRSASFRGVLLLGILLASSFGLDIIGRTDSLRMQDWLMDGAIQGSVIGSSGWILQHQLARLHKRTTSISPSRTSLWSQLLGRSWVLSVRQAVRAGLLLGGGYGLSAWLSTGLGAGLIASLGGGMSDLPINLLVNLLMHVEAGLLIGMSFGLLSGLSFWFIHLILQSQGANIHLAEHVRWSWRALLRWSHLRNSLLTALFVGCFFGLSSGLSSGLLNGFPRGLSVGLSVGLSEGLGEGLSAGLSVGLSYWFLFGLYRGLRQEHLEEHDRRQFNQGLRHSFFTIVLLSSLSAGVIAGIAIVFCYGLGLAPSFGLSIGLHFGLSVGWLLALCGWVVVWGATGGLTILRHYTLRLLLARRHLFPLHARRFLDDAVARVLLKRQGGGYSFIHRRLLTFFADAPASTRANHATVEQTPSVSAVLQPVREESHEERDRSS